MPPVGNAELWLRRRGPADFSALPTGGMQACVCMCICAFFLLHHSKGERTVRFKGKKSQARRKIKEAFRLTVCSSFKQRVGLWPWLLVCQPTPGNGNDWPSRFARPAFNAFEHRGLCSNRWSHSNHMCMARFPRFANILPLDFLQPCALLSRQLHTRPSKELKVTVCATSF